MKLLQPVKFLFTACCLLLLGCSEITPEPACVQAQVIGLDCQNGWYVLHLTGNDSRTATRAYIGQLQEGFVTTDNLPEAYREPGLTLTVALELNTDYSPVCTAVNMMYPTVRVKKVCSVVASLR
ncbi:hypothetical protein [Pontibacter sp. SGAir0037]|uniref:hypothetical protein n=1 Tax=Pontibacter sp. SGAir0037 TaxID=2571030 RepID=UPI0010CD5163|nr:hypothetical protein [Pontibacter sp. SGAir0037]QCR23627.1 hypothetical protein C1N53_15605 [Pontibacter sp. SGAir0037]